MSPSPVIELNRAVAVAMADGPDAGLALMEPLADELDRYHLFHAARADLLRQEPDARSRRRLRIERALDSGHEPGRAQVLDAARVAGLTAGSEAVSEAVRAAS